MRIGIIGLGAMGNAAAEKLREYGFTVCGHDISPSVVERAETAGIPMYASPADLAFASEVLMLFVPGPYETEQVIAGENGALKKARPGLVILNMSTVGPDVIIHMGELAAAGGVAVVDAPVFGARDKAGSWAFAVGGELWDIDLVKPVLSVLGGSPAKVFHVGALGDGNKLKLLNNMMLGAISACAAEIMALAHYMGIPQSMLAEVAVAAGARTVSPLYRDISERIAEERYDEPELSVDMLAKDNQLCLEMARERNIPMVLGQAVDTLNRLASLHGLGSEDHAAIWKMLAASWSGKPQA